AARSLTQTLELHLERNGFSRLEAAERPFEPPGGLSDPFRRLACGESRVKIDDSEDIRELLPGHIDDVQHILATRPDGALCRAEQPDVEPFGNELHADRFPDRLDAVRGQ